MSAYETMQSNDDTLINILIVAATSILGLAFVYFIQRFLKSSDSDRTKTETAENASNKLTLNSTSKSQTGDQKQKRANAYRKGDTAHAKHPVFEHPWLACALKSHTSSVLHFSFSPNGKYLASCSDDRSVLLWSVKEIEQRDKKTLRANIEYDHACRVAFSPDNKAFLAVLANENTIRIVKIGKKPDGSVGKFETAFDFPKEHSHDIICLGIATTGRFITTCDAGTVLKIWSTKGQSLATLDTLQINSNWAAISPCGRFVASCGFTSDVKVWEVIFDKAGIEFKEVKRAFELKGHTASVYCFDFNIDSTKMVTASKDGTWRLWNTTHCIAGLGSDPELLSTGSFSLPSSSIPSGAPQEPFSVPPVIITLSPDAHSIGLALTNQNTSTILCYDGETGQLDCSIDMSELRQPITCLSYDVSGRYLVTSCGRVIYAFHNITGYRVIRRVNEERIETCKSGAQRDRLRLQMEQAEDALKRIVGE